MARSLTQKIFYAFVLGILIGISIGYLPITVNIKDTLIEFFNFGGNVFLKTIKMLVVPIVFFFSY